MSDESSSVPAARLQPSASYSFTMRLHMPQQGGAFARIAQAAIAGAEAMLGGIDLVRVESRELVRDVTVACVGAGHAEAVVRAVRALDGVRVEAPALVAGLKTARQSGDAEEVRRAAHTLKSNARTFGAAGLANIEDEYARVASALATAPEERRRA
jgi:Hpt domain